ncbi:MAG: hypothetical protein SFU87_02095 [Chitinophagaceae bacterium]|nr:hypothetical protein [Chitinophagaceae bacterium]
MIKRAAYIILTSAVLCFVAAKVFDHGLKKYYQYTFKKLDHILTNNEHHDVLLLGNSFMYYGINPAVIDPATGYNSFNAGLGGAELPELKFLLDSYLKQHTPPRYLFLQLHYSSLDHSNLENLVYYSYYKWGPELPALMKLNGMDTAYLRRFVPFNRFTYFNDYIRTKTIHGMLGNDQGGPGCFYYKGFLKRKADTTVLFSALKTETAVSKTPSADSSLKRSKIILKEIYDKCMKSGIQLVIIHPPQPLTKEKREKASSLFSELVRSALPGKTTLLDYSTDSTLCQPAFFLDETHLNKKGSEVFSLRVAQDFNNTFQTEKDK